MSGTGRVKRLSACHTCAGQETRCGENEYTLSPEEEITIEIKDGDCMYFDEVYVERNPQENTRIRDTRIRRIRRGNQ